MKTDEYKQLMEELQKIESGENSNSKEGEKDETDEENSNKEESTDDKSTEKESEEINKIENE